MVMFTTLLEFPPQDKIAFVNVLLHCLSVLSVLCSPKSYFYYSVHHAYILDSLN